MSVNRDKDDLGAEPARAGSAFPGQRSDPDKVAASSTDDIEPDQVDSRDISTILMGAQAISGKAVMSAARMTVNPQQHEQQETQRKAREKEAREQANLAAWGAKTTTVGGVQMTNAQAQEARQNVINNGDAYADWAVRKGLIKEDEKDAFKTGIKRKMELEDKRGRGTLTTAEAAEEAQLDRSRVGKALDAATAYDHQHQGQAPVPEATADTRVRGTSSTALDRSALFQSAPDANAAFNTASNATPLQKPPQAQPVAPSIKATGLDL